MKVKLNVPVEKWDCAVGDECEVNDFIGNAMIARGDAVAVKEVKEKVKAKKTATKAKTDVEVAVRADKKSETR